MNDYNFSYYIAGWIDLLGQTEALERIPDIPLTHEEHGPFNKAISATFVPIEKFRQAVTDIHKQMTQPLRLPEGQYNDEQRAIFKKHTTVKISYSFISDSALLHICLQEDENHVPPVYSIYTLIEQLSLLMLSSLAVSVPLRGAIEIGICSELGDGTLYGQAISRAHYIESKCAHYPRIVIGPNFANLFKYIETQCQQSSLPPIEKNMLMHWISLIKEACEHDTYDGHYILSYLRQCQKGSGQDQASYKSLIEEAASFVDKSLSKYRASGNAKLAERYSVLKDYFIKHGCWHPYTGEVLARA